MPVHHVKGQPAVSEYVREKGGVTCYTNRGTPCRILAHVICGEAANSSRRKLFSSFFLCPKRAKTLQNNMVPYFALVINLKWEAFWRPQ